MPRFSVVIPAYNASATVAETLDAVAGQVYADWECIVVDDGSTDETAAVVMKYVDRDSRFRLIRQENKGAAGAYRTAIAAAEADMIVICAADDLLLPGHLSVMDDLVSRNPDCGIFSSNGQHLMHETGERKVVYETEPWQIERSLSLEEVIDTCFFSVGATFRCEEYELAEGHRPGVYVDDYDLWLRAMARGAKHRYTPAVLAVHRVSGFQQSASLRKVFESRIEVYTRLLQERGLSNAQRDAISSGIAESQRRIKGLVQDSLERQAVDLRSRLEARLGSRRADVALRVIHAFSWITRPFRRFMARRTLK